MLAAQLAPDAARRLVVIYGFAYDPGRQVRGLRACRARPAREKNTAESAASDFISPKVTPPAVVKAFVDQALEPTRCSSTSRTTPSSTRSIPRV